MATLSVFDFQDYRAYLSESKRNFPGRKRPVSLEQWSRLLGYRSPRTIAMILNGRRLPSRDAVHRLAKVLKMTPAEQRYFELMVLRERYARRRKDPASIEDELQGLQPRRFSQKELEPRLFESFAHWLSFVLRQLCATPSARPSLEWMHRRLRQKASLEEIQSVLYNLLRLGFLKRNPTSGRLEAADQSGITTGRDVPSLAIRHYHVQMMERAREALFEQDLERREFGALTVQLDPKRLPEFKKRIREFLSDFSQGCQSPSDHIFQLNVQLFEHTQADDA